MVNSQTLWVDYNNLLDVLHWDSDQCRWVVHPSDLDTLRDEAIPTEHPEIKSEGAWDMELGEFKCPNCGEQPAFTVFRNGNYILPPHCYNCGQRNV